MTNGGQRIATASGVMLADPAGLGNALLRDAQALFEPDFWAARGELSAVSGGRGAAWFIGPAANQWVLRHYRRGGFIAANLEGPLCVGGREPCTRLCGVAPARAARASSGLPVPKPIAAWYRRSGLTYRCDLITQRIADAQALSAVLRSVALPQADVARRRRRDREIASCRRGSCGSQRPQHFARCRAAASV